MKLRNKKTSEIADVQIFGENFLIEAKDYPNNLTKVISSLAELKEDWEDYEETKDHWHIGCEGDVFIDNTERYLKSYSSIGNDFDSREEAEKVVEKLKAWKRLKDKGFRFERWLIGGEYGNTITFSDYIKCNDETRADLDSLFGGEDE